MLYEMNGLTCRVALSGQNGGKHELLDAIYIYNSFPYLTSLSSFCLLQVASKTKCRMLMFRNLTQNIEILLVVPASTLGVC